jgi:hypothetical protein
MPSTPPGIGQPTREARTGREDRGQRENKWWTLVAGPGLEFRGPAVGRRRLRADPGVVPAHGGQAAGTITRAAFTTGLNRILRVAAIIAFVAGTVSLAAIRTRDFARAAPGDPEGPGK